MQSMLIQCKACNVSFDDSLGKCIGCGEPITFSCEELLEKCILQVRSWYREGKKIKAIRRELEALDVLDEHETELVIHAGLSRQRDANKRLGRYITCSGFLLLLAGTLIYLFSFGIEVHFEFLAVGFALFVVGVLQSITGRNLAGYD
jgi:hypothetical protein